MKLAFVSLLAAVPASLLCAQNDMIGVAWAGTSYALSSATGVGTTLGASGFTSLNSMANVGGTAVTASGGNLVAIDPVTGLGTLLVSTGLTDLRGMATDPAGNLWAVANGGGTTVADVLYLIDVGSGTATMIGPTTPYSGIQGLAFDAAGVLYAWDVGSGSGVGAGLVIIDTATGAGTDVNPSVGNSVSIQCLATSPTGTMYGARAELYVIDTATGIGTLVGSGGYSDLRGIDFVGGGGPSASCTLRNGTGVNPVVCGCTTLPVLGTVWNVGVTPAANTLATFVFLADMPLPFPVPLFGGEALIAPPAADMPATGPGTHSLALPNNPLFLGFPIFLQGLRLNAVPVGLDLQLTNAQDAIVGL